VLTASDDLVTDTNTSRGCCGSPGSGSGSGR